MMLATAWLKLEEVRKQTVYARKHAATKFAQADRRGVEVLSNLFGSRRIAALSIGTYESID